MSEPTYTLETIRRAICRQLHMRFFRIYEGEITLTGGSTTTAVAANILAQADDFWNNAYLLVVSGNQDGDFRRITDFVAATDTATLEYALSGTLSSGDKVEILDYSPEIIHEAINRAVMDGFRAFPNVAENQTMIIQEDTLEYSLSGISPAIWMPIQVWLERSSNVIRGQAESATSNTLTDTDANWTTNEHAGKLLSIYYGTGAGQAIVTIQSNTATVLTISGTFATTPDSTSRYAVWDPNEQLEDWYRLPAGRFGPEEFPDTLRLTKRYPDFYGLRIRFVYLQGPDTLSADTDTTTVNREFVVYKATSIIHDSLVSDSTVNRSAHASMAEYFDRIARDVLDRHRRLIPPFTVWVEEDTATESWEGDNILWPVID